MKAPGLHWIYLLCAGLAGCSTYTVHPLYTVEDSIVEPAVEGTWVSDDKTEFHVAKASANEYSLEVAPADSEVLQHYTVHLVRLGDQLFADMIFESQTLDGTKLDDAAGLVPAHVILKLNLDANKLGYATLDKDAIVSQIAGDTQPMEKLMVENVLLLTAPTEVLRSYVSAQAETVFTQTDYMTKKNQPSQ